MEQRKEEPRRSCLIAKESWSRGELVPFYNPADTASWYLFQGNAYATDRMNWVPEEAVRIVPTLTRIGEELTKLLAIPGAERSEERRVGKECVITCRSRWSPYH